MVGSLLAWDAGYVAASARSSRPILVLGAERSGTSMVTEVIHNWGAYVGETADLPPPDGLNARGRWEYEPLWELLAELGEFDTGRSWWDASFQDLVAAKAADPYHRGRAHELMNAMDQGTP